MADRREALRASARQDGTAEKAARIVQLHTLIDALEALAGPYDIAGLQARRAEIKGLKRTATSIFGLQRRDKDWVFHHGGRTELQFNAGLDTLPGDVDAFRIGVAFSLEASQTLPDVAALAPNIARFGDWIDANPEVFGDLAMWHFHKGERSADYRPGPVSGEVLTVAWAQKRTFVFLGDRQPLWEVDLHRALGVMDRLLPLWDWVERGLAAERGLDAIGLGIETPAGVDVMETLALDRRRQIGEARWISATIQQRTDTIALRHREIQRRLRIELLAEGCAEVFVEAQIGMRAIDLVARHGKGLWFYEVKTGATDRACLREAIGQLLEYALWPGATRPERLVVVGEPALTAKGQAYLDTLRAELRIQLDYRQLKLD